MSVVSYNEKNMEEVISVYKDAWTKICGARGARAVIEQNINEIKNNWKGTDATKAYEDLNAVNNMMATIGDNINEVYQALKEVKENFGQLNWTE